MMLSISSVEDLNSFFGRITKMVLTYAQDRVQYTSPQANQPSNQTSTSSPSLLQIKTLASNYQEGWLIPIVVVYKGYQALFNEENKKEHAGCAADFIAFLGGLDSLLGRATRVLKEENNGSTDLEASGLLRDVIEFKAKIITFHREKAFLLDCGDGVADISKVTSQSVFVVSLYHDLFFVSDLLTNVLDTLRVICLLKASRSADPKHTLEETPLWANQILPASLPWRKDLVQSMDSVSRPSTKFLLTSKISTK